MLELNDQDKWKSFILQEFSSPRARRKEASRVENTEI